VLIEQLQGQEKKKTLNGSIQDIWAKSRFKTTTRNDQTLINVIHAKKKNRYFIRLEHAAKLGSEGVGKNHYFHMFLDFLQGKDLLLEMEIKGTKHNSSL